MKYLDRLPRLVIPRRPYSEDHIFYVSPTGGYRSYRISDDLLLEQLGSMFGPILDQIEGMFVQRINANWNGYKHRDPRKFAINYILDQGGPVVTTTFYDPERPSLVDRSEVIEPHAWHYFDSSNYHQVDGIATVRTTVTVSIKHMPRMDAIEWLDSQCSAAF